MRFSIGITIHNEERNIRALLDLLRAEDLERLGLVRVYVISSGSTDRSDDIVREVAAAWPRVILLVERERRGKASAINVFLDAARAETPQPPELLVLASGDVLPAPGAVARILAAFADPEVAMAGGRPVPQGQPTRLIHHVVRLQWDLHHEVSLVSPKLGEVVAFRNQVDRIPADTAVDEAAIEAIFRARGRRFAYVGDAVIRNKGPESVRDYLKQRRRIAAGHAHLSATSRYDVSTSRNSFILPIVVKALLREPRRIPVAIATVALEAWGRTLGWWDLKVKKKNPYIWDVAASTKDLEGVAAGLGAPAGER